MLIVDFERDIGPIKIKGTIEKAGQIKGEIGTHIPAFDYKSLNPFAGFIKDGVHGSFDLRAGITDSYFCISVKGHAVIAQTNLPDKGHETTIFELEATVQGAIRFTRHNNVAYFDSVDGSPCHFEFDFQGFNLSPLDTPIAILTYRSLQKLHGPQTVQGIIEPTKYSFKPQVEKI
ncbi:uncharacterized protein ACHE_10446A [Aspergillus chevalieri]|uniref:Uncharacterized protein n=1 Tax=Aspergillus chevalieri TaxID=182096 RepID=A0A7R7ZJ01_ASPCH|nr:uncharacterized protein ACHE_10446A [Aspergillus chevalieri]BCR83044.1 hypothetical protein ACHE_10446A [Aspergillus chevalieri]